MGYKYLNKDKKDKIRNWVLKIGYDKALKILNEEHNKIFCNLGNEQEEYDNKKIDRFEEIVEAIEYVSFLKNIKVHNLTFYNNR